MASASSLQMDDLSCSLCGEIFTDPVLLSCSHTIGKGCLQLWWEVKGIRECPVCEVVHSTDDPPCNLALKNLCEAFVQGRQGASKRKRTPGSDLCSLHAEELKLFCLECQEPVCLVCRDSKKHTSHSFRPIDEVVLDHKEEVRKLLKPLQEKLELFKTSDRKAKHFKFQAQDTERQIEEQFTKLYQYLQEMEERSLTKLREEEKLKSQMMKDNIESLERDMATISHTIKATEEQLKAGHISFLQNYKTTIERVSQLTLPDPQPFSAPVIDVAKHLGNLTFRVWDEMRCIIDYSPVILDPNTAHPVLFVSDDLTSVRAGEEGQMFPDNRERFDHYGYVLGSRGISSEIHGTGIHGWDVEVGNNTDWELGVLAGSYQRRGDGGGALWGIAFHEGKYTAHSSRPLGAVTELLLKQKPQKIRVRLDWNGGKLSFCDPYTGEHIHTFTHTFTETLFPYINTGHPRPLKIRPLPTRVFVTLEQCWDSSIGFQA